MVAYHRICRGLHFSLGVLRGIGLVGEGEHTQVIVAVTETDNPLYPQVLLETGNGAALVALRMVQIQPT